MKKKKQGIQSKLSECVETFPILIKVVVVVVLNGKNNGGKIRA